MRRSNMETNIISSMLGDLKQPMAIIEENKTGKSLLYNRSYITYKFHGSFHLTTGIHEGVHKINNFNLMSTRSIDCDVAMRQCG